MEVQCLFRHDLQLTSVTYTIAAFYFLKHGNKSLKKWTKSIILERTYDPYLFSYLTWKLNRLLLSIFWVKEFELSVKVSQSLGKHETILKTLFEGEKEQNWEAIIHV